MVMVVDAFDSVQFRLGGEIDRLQLEMTRLRAELDGSEAKFVVARVQMSTSDTAPTDRAGTSTQDPTSSPDLDFKGWLGGDFDDTDPLD
uniref:Uncharacterized protein n=1 Tax=Fagus sylvatica TaxID=28930 RepID=A0A2N9GJV6_FAGSY